MVLSIYTTSFHGIGISNLNVIILFSYICRKYQLVLTTCSPADGPQDHEYGNTIEVRGFNPTTSDETIESFFENKRRSGGGELEGIHLNRVNDVVRITYKDPRG